MSQIDWDYQRTCIEFQLGWKPEYFDLTIFEFFLDFGLAIFKFFPDFDLEFQ